MKILNLIILYLLFLNNLFSQDSLRLYLSFDNNLHDQSNFEYNAIELANLEYTESPCNKSIKITNNELDAISVSGDVINQLQDFTISALVRIDGFNSNNNLISCSNEYQPNELIVGYNFGVDSFQDGWHLIINNSIYYFENETTMNDLNWHQIVITRKGNEGRLYIDNQQIGNEIYVDNKSLNVATNGFVIGHDQDCIEGCFEINQSWFGEIDDLKVFSKALNENELEFVSCLDFSPSELDKNLCKKIYPTPFKTNFTIDIDSNLCNSYELVTSSGAIVSSGLIPESKIVQINENIASGTYFIRLFNGFSPKSKLTCKQIKIND